jgi:Spy/CpxP family protein refolding chaperone
MKPRTIRRLVVAGLAAAAVALGIFGTMATSSASDMEWHMPVNHTVVR